MTFPYKKLSFSFTADLQPRARDIVTRRFGLGGQEPETLEAIGQSHRITRERVRQIVEDVIVQLKAVHKEDEKLQAIFENFSEYLRRSGNLKRQDLLVQELGVPQAANHIVFLLHLGEQFHRHRETEYVHPFWANKKEVMEMSPAFLDVLCAYLQERREALEFDELVKVRLAREGERVQPRTLASLLEVSKQIARSYNGKWGLQEWPEVRPKGMREKAYVVLREQGKPLHFVEVAKLIEKLQESVAEQKKKTVLPQTVHNELIKDSRFVLVGRGIYALDEWGYRPGTVKDVMVGILRENGHAMTREELVQKTLSQRQVKESTILLNLQDKTCFLREGEGYYCLPK